MNPTAWPRWQAESPSALAPFIGLAVALGLGVLIVPVGLWLRRSLPETFHGRSVKERPAMRPLARVAIIGLFLLAAGTIGAYTTSYSSVGFNGFPPLAAVFLN